MRLLAAHIVVLAFVALSLRTGETRAVLDALWDGPWGNARWILVAFTGLAVLLSARVFARHGRIALSVTALAAAAASRYLTFAVH